MSVKDANGISKWLDENIIQYELNVDLTKKTWIKNGGIAEIYITPDNVGQLERVLLEITKLKARYILVGHTSNMFFSNSYNPFIIISTRKINKYYLEGNKSIIVKKIYPAH